ncbi:TetR/AcrR family transcriptional regulator [Microbacterium sp. ASV49]|uniref:TetR/AcrR family transcriptional regulator n=1 Tax=Microbacterium candidum TaxID=3041922 RepID=A0ABT7MV91_9MICO|nr:TetR/AcrR family transcriptional regulator [Microbacterium sp. ASV49]MDL9978364.1 TetR/AcrR family transcriptional regulator [Microbacterium sp. ASV49]
MTSTGPRTSSRPGKSAIIAAALQCFHERGYEGSSIRDVAQVAGVTGAAVYHYYDSKQDLLMEIMEDFLAKSITATKNAVARAGSDPVARLFAAAQSHVLWNTSDIAASFVVNSEIRSLSPENRAKHIPKRDELQRIFDSAVEDGCREGLFETPWPLEASRAVTVMCTFVARWYRPGGPLSAEEISWRYGHMALSLVRAVRGPHMELPAYDGGMTIEPTSF